MDHLILTTPLSGVVCFRSLSWSEVFMSTGYKDMNTKNIRKQVSGAILEIPGDT